MRNAPSVQYPVGRSAFHAGVVMVLAGLGALALLLPVLWYQGVPGAFWVVGLLLWLLWVVWAGCGWWMAPCGCLYWDARAVLAGGTRVGVWRWQPDGGPAVDLQSLEWAWDAQSLVLLRPRACGLRLPWLWLDGRREPLRWDDLRRALTAHAGHPPPS